LCRTTIRKSTFEPFRRSCCFFSLTEITEENGRTVEKNFQSFTFSNAKTTFPVSFALNVDSPKDCPKQLQLYVTGSDRDGFHYEYPLRGWKKINLEKIEFERVIVYPQTF
jgi:hypothetical protein